MTVRAPLVLGSVISSLALASTAGAESTPLGRLPTSPVTMITAHRGSFVAVALPRQAPATGLVWRLARAVDASVLRQISEADVGESVVVVFRTVRKGKARVAFALSAGEHGGKPIRASIYSIHVR